MNASMPSDSPETARPHGVRVVILRLIKLIVLPFRFAWLLIVWLRLRGVPMK